MLARHKIPQLRKAFHRIAVRTKPPNAMSKTTPRKASYSPIELLSFRKILLAMREEACSVMRDYQDSIQSIESNQPSYVHREPPVSFNERSADTSMREEYALCIGRQIKLIGYLDATLKRIDEGRYGICISCKEVIARERLEAVPHTQLCLNCKQGGNNSIGLTSAQPSPNRSGIVLHKTRRCK